MIAPAASAACREHDAPQLVGGELRLRLYTHGSRVNPPPPQTPPTSARYLELYLYGGPWGAAHKEAPQS